MKRKRISVDSLFMDYCSVCETYKLSGRGHDPRVCYRGCNNPDLKNFVLIRDIRYKRKRIQPAYYNKFGRPKSHIRSNTVHREIVI